MSLFSKDRYEELLLKVKSSTIKTYTARVTKLLKDMYKGNVTLMILVTDSENIISYVENITNLNTRKTTYLAIKFVIGEDYFNKKYGAAFKICAREQIADTYYKPHDCTNFLSLEKMWKICEGAKDAIGVTAQVYSKMPFFRGKAIYASKILKENDNISNCIVGDKFYLNDYKTVKKYGKRVYNIPKVLIEPMNSIKLSCEQSTMSRRVKSKLGIKINDIRRIYTNEILRYVYEKYPSKINEVRKRLAELLNHSVYMQEFTYSCRYEKKIPLSSDEYMETMFKLFLEY
jgi:hypothetical protein